MEILLTARGGCRCGRGSCDGATCRCRFAVIATNNATKNALSGSRAALWLVGAALLTSLVLGAAFIVVHRTNDLRGEAVEAPREPLSDEQAMAQVIDSAAEFIRAGSLGAPSATYLLQSCGSDGGPPYQGSAYVNFDMPSITETPAFLRRLSAAMSRNGWKEGLRPNDHPGGKILARSGISGLIYRNPDVDGRGVLQIYGECRTVTDHREENLSFIDITDRLR